MNYSALTTLILEGDK